MTPLTFEKAQKQAYEVARNNGFWDGNASRNVGEMLMLMVTELAEAMEHYRQPFNASMVREGQHYQVEKSYYTLDGKPDGFYIELTDCIIRILDICAHDKVDLGELVRIKMAYNRTRGYRHGGKRA